MPRPSRKLLLSKINHIMLRGIGHMNLFEDNRDFQQFLNSLIKFKQETDISILAYCLMDNHVHILVKASPEDIPLFFKKVEISYAAYFNGTHEHTGHLFQNRYKSEAIKNDSHFLAALSYILRNPEAAGICRWETYPWSSAKCYLRDISDGITAASQSLDMIGGKERFLCLMNNQERVSEISFAEPGDNRKLIRDHSAILFLKQISGLDDPLQLQTMEKAARDRLLSQLKQAGMTVRQLERLTGINRNTIQRAR